MGSGISKQAWNPPVIKVQLCNFSLKEYLNALYNDIIEIEKVGPRGFYNVSGAVIS